MHYSIPVDWGPSELFFILFSRLLSLTSLAFLYQYHRVQNSTPFRREGVSCDFIFHIYLISLVLVKE